MKKFGIIIAVALVIILALSLVACDGMFGDGSGNTGNDNGTTPNPEEYKVTIHPNNGQDNVDWKITDPIPEFTYEGHVIEGFYLDGDFTTSISLSTLKLTGLTGNIDVYIKWKEGCAHEVTTIQGTPATCTEDGLTDGKYCSKCETMLVEQEVIPAKHTPAQAVVENRISETCTEAGSFDKVVYCVECGTEISREHKTIEPSHKIVEHEGQEETCTEDGWQPYQTCSRCDYTTYETIPAQHKLEEHASQEPTCTEIGWNSYVTCSCCDYTTYVEIPAGHIIVNHDGKEATCTEIGWEAYEDCSRCDYTTYVEIPAGHIIVNHDAKEPTSCAEAGWEAYETCSRCNYTTYEEIPAGHIIVNHDAKESTCVEVGWEAYEACSRCKYTTYVEIPAPGHAWGDWYETEAPTDTEAGEERRDCDNCDCYETNVLPALIQSGTWGNLTWTLNTTTGHLTISGTGEMDGFEMGESTIEPIRAWRGYKDIIKSVIIENGVTTISYRAFYGCSSLTSMTIGNSVTTIGGYAFSGCDSLESVTFEDTTNWYVDGNGIIDVTNASTNANYLTDTYEYYGWYKADENGFCIVDNGTEKTLVRYCGTATDVVIPDSVTSIGSYAFDNCTSLTSVVIPDSVTTIGNNVFAGCTNIVEITGPTIAINNIPKDSLQTVVITGGTSISEYAFAYCDSLTSIVIPDSVTTIGPYAFYKCTGLTNVYYLGTLEQWCDITFEQDDNSGYYSNPMNYANNLYIDGELLAGELVIPSTVTEIKEAVFLYCTSLTSITIPDSVTIIGDFAFAGCTSLTYNTYDNGKYLGNELNPYLVLVEVTSTSITSCEINENCEFISTGAFYNCTSLTNVTIPDTVTSIGMLAFGCCTNLTSVTFGENSQLTSVGDHAFYECTSLTSITIPGSVTNIGRFAFSYCSSLTSVTFGENRQLTSVGDHAFYECTNLTSITIPSSVTTIGAYSFDGCSNLTSITIPSSVTTIGKSAFNGCSSLTDVYYTGTEEQWNIISIGSYNTYLTNATRYYFSVCIHNSNQWRYDDEGNVSTDLTIGDCIVDVEPTCTTSGSKHAICNVCGETITIEKISATGHSCGDDGVCTACGEEIPYTITNDATYAFVEIDGILQSTNHDGGSSSSYVITANTTITITFEYNVSSEASWDKFYINHNSIKELEASGTSNSYTRYSITLNAGDTLTFKYTKDSSTSRGDDCCYIKNLTITTVNN